MSRICDLPVVIDLREKLILPGLVKVKLIANSQKGLLHLENLYDGLMDTTRNQLWATTNDKK